MLSQLVSSLKNESGSELHISPQHILERS